MFRKKDGGISVVAKNRPAIRSFFDNHYNLREVYPSAVRHLLKVPRKDYRMNHDARTVKDNSAAKISLSKHIR
jgi:hypothetical protein